MHKGHGYGRTRFSHAGLKSSISPLYDFSPLEACVYEAKEETNTKIITLLSFPLSFKQPSVDDCLATGSLQNQNGTTK